MLRFSFVLTLVVVVWPAAGSAQDVDFNRDIRPILARRCFACHGPDPEGRAADLRLDSSAAASELTSDGIAAIRPGDPENSALMARVTSADPDIRMPPAPGHAPLTVREIDLLRTWIAAGAEYEPHWAFLAPVRPAVPSIASHPVDAFIRQSLQSKNLASAPRAEVSTLIRRVSLDLIGLPPTVAEQQEFAEAMNAQGFDNAYRSYVDRLLASPHYGERWARRWLDLARYADTNGYEKDRERQIWAYRDWVVSALNEDLPFDEFTRRQLAGDQLPNHTLEDLVATGFHRNTMLNEEGGIDPQEYRFYAMTDRVATTGTTWLGLTLGCVQCHTHKYDPIQHTEYYALMALMNNVHEVMLDLPDTAREENYSRRLEQAAKLIEELPGKWPLPADAKNSPEPTSPAISVEQRFEQWLTERRGQFIPWITLQPLAATSNLPVLTILDDASILAAGDSTKQDRYDIRYDLPPGTITALRLEALPDDSLPAHGPGSTYYEGTLGDFFLGELTGNCRETSLEFGAVTESFSANRFGKNPVTAALSVDGDPQTGWAVHGRQGERHTAIYSLKTPLQGGTTLDLTMHFGRHYSSSLGRFRLSATTTELIPAAQDVTAEIEALLLKPDDALSPAERQQLFEEFLLNAPELKQHADQIRQLRKPPELATTLIFRELPGDTPRPTYRHVRGEFLRPAEVVEPGTPAVLHDWPANARRTRIGLAEWLNSPENPLTARVVVNRHWAALFGRGIVETTEDFGTQGASPSHPELLDWLAVEFREQGWSVKSLHRLLVTSETYQQSSIATPEQRALDPENIWLSRASRPRLDAEVIRDSILRSAGILSDHRGGPGIRPPQPVGVTETAYGSPKWVPSEGEARYRRSLYTFVKRTAPFAMYQVFDAPSGEACIARRDQSDTPLQALTMLNDVMLLEASQAFGKELSDYVDKTDQQRIQFAFLRILSRSASPEEVELLTRFVREQRRRIDQGQLSAADIAGIDAPEAAVWTTLVRPLFTLDEVVSRN